jgi:hypothetical protein
MDLLLILMRLLHVGLGVFWVGAVLFNVIFLTPSLKDAGPDGAKVAAGLMKRGFMQVMPIVGILNILSGLWLYWKMSGGFQSAYLHSRPGIAFGLGGLMAILAFTIGVVVIRPAMLQAMSLGQSAAQAPAAEREAIMAKAQALRERGTAAGNLVVVLLGLTAAAMAVARYL